MAMPIKHTPVLHGKSAKEFLRKVEEKQNSISKPVPTPKAKEALRKILEDAGIR